jgi:Flp pilus assembly protein TadD
MSVAPQTTEALFEPPPAPQSRRPRLQARAQLLHELGDCHAELEEFPQAEDCYLQAHRLSPDTPEGHLSLGMLAMRRGDLAAARGAFSLALACDGGCSEAYTALGWLDLQEDRCEAAFDLFLMALEADADNLLALLGLFEASCRRGSFEKITGYLQTYLEGHPGDTAVLLCLASLYAREDKLLLARRTLQDLLEIEPDKAEAREMLESVEDALRREFAAAKQDEPERTENA